ncbi:hypothetical protein OOJ91_12000 [Micromonospora lupini]|uniref:hypothetical protein n=1 Tax=Micromonospora lupini TaxID=285679 RepID=UPI0022568433|nr:hypothetical protein [Micromonospora lupini]MCX5066600.1 hypothetical protein [Micromonospora lupini]
MSDGMDGLDPRTVAADIMCGNARDITPGEVWAHIGQAYDTTEIDATIADDVTALIRAAGIDLIWPDGTKNTELDASRVENERLTAELVKATDEANRLRTEWDRLVNERAAMLRLVDAVRVWRHQFSKPSGFPRQAAVIAAFDALPADALAGEAVTR